MGKTTQGAVKSVASASCTCRRCHIGAEPGQSSQVPGAVESWQASSQPAGTKDFFI